MQKLIFILFFSFNTMFSITFANITPNQPIVYCPNEIQCTVNGDINACYISDNPYQLWNIQSSGVQGRIIKGTYKFKRAYAFYYSFSGITITNKHLSFNGWDNCIYSNIGSLGVERLISLNTNAKNGMTKGQQFESFLDAKNQWAVVGYEAECSSNTPKSCPLIEAPELIYIPEAGKTQGFDLGGTYCSPNSPLIGFDIIRYEGIMSICGASSLCKLDIFSCSTDKSKKNILGNIIIDISVPDFVKILNINPDPSAPCVLKKKEPLNTIYCDPKKITGITN